MIITLDEKSMQQWASRLGRLLAGGEVIELVGDVGSGKTTLTKAVAIGLGIDEDVQSPSFTISRVYSTPDDLQLVHYDFYRLHDAGIMANELAETVQDDRNITIIEWAGLVDGILPADRLTIELTSPSADQRTLTIAAGGDTSQQLLEAMA